MTVPVPSRSEPSVAALRASGSTRARTLTMALKNFSASTPLIELSAAGSSAANAESVIADPAASSHREARRQERECRGSITTSLSKPTPRPALKSARATVSRRQRAGSPEGESCHRLDPGVRGRFRRL